MKAPQRVRGTALVLLAQTLWVAMLRVRVKAGLKHNDLGEATISGAEQRASGRAGPSARASLPGGDASPSKDIVPHCSVTATWGTLIGYLACHPKAIMP